MRSLPLALSLLVPTLASGVYRCQSLGDALLEEERVLADEERALSRFSDVYLDRHRAMRSGHTLVREHLARGTYTFTANAVRQAAERGFSHEDVRRMLGESVVKTKRAKRGNSQQIVVFSFGRSKTGQFGAVNFQGDIMMIVSIAFKDF